MKRWGTLNYVWALWRFQAGPMLANTVLWFLMLGLPLATGLILQRAFNLLSGDAAAGSDLRTLLALVLALEVARQVIILVRQRNDVIIQFAIGALIRQNIFRHLLEYAGPRALPHSPGEAVSRVKGDTGEVMGRINWPVSIAGQALSAIIALVIMARVNLSVTLLVFVPVLLVIGVVHLGRDRLVRLRRASSQRAGDVSGFVGEMFGAVQAVKVAGAEASVLAEFGGLNEQRKLDTVRERVFNSALDSFYTLTVGLGTGGILLLAAGGMQSGRFTVGDFALFEFYMGYVTQLPFWTGFLLASVKQLGVAFERLHALLPGAARSLGRAGPGVLPQPAARGAIYREDTGRPARVPGSARPDLSLSRLGPRH